MTLPDLCRGASQPTRQCCDAHANTETYFLRQGLKAWIVCVNVLIDRKRL